MDETCTVEYLVELLMGDKWDENSEELPQGTENWLESQDALNRKNPLDRRNAARIIHMYMRAVLGIKDLEDITPAYELRDLFDCRVCANHIAQVYVRGIIDSVSLGDMKIFDVYGEVKKSEAEKWLADFT